jgi:hypothetical protein
MRSSAVFLSARTLPLSVTSVTGDSNPVERVFPRKGKIVPHSQAPLNYRLIFEGFVSGKETRSKVTSGQLTTNIALKST